MIVVVGAGVAGLVAARDVLKARPGGQVVVLESADRVGGKLRLDEVGGHLVDTGSEAMLALRPEAVDLVADLGEQAATPATTTASIWTRGALHPVPRATLMGIPARSADCTGILTEEERARSLDEQPWPGGPLTQDVSVGEYVEARLGRAVVDRLVEPLLGGVYAGSSDTLSLQATLPQAWAKAQAGESILPSFPVPPPGAAPAAPRPVFIGLEGGVGRLPEILRDDVLARGGEVRTGVTVTGLGRSAAGWQVALGDGSALTAEAVVLAVPAPALATLLGPHAPAAAEALGGIPMASSAVITLAVPRAGLADLPGSGFLVPPIEGHLVKASTFSSRKWGWTDALSPDLVHIRASIGRAGDDADVFREDDDLVAASAEEIGRALGTPLPALIDSHVQRWVEGLPQYTVGHVARIERARAAVDALPRLEIAGAALDGVGIPAVIASAHRAADAVLAEFSDPEVPTA